MTADTVLSGSLKEFGLVEVLQVVEMGSMTGAVHLKRNAGQMGILYFNEGKLANCSEFDPGALKLGDVLQQLSMTTYEAIEQAYAQQLQDPLGKRIGERLVMMGLITEDQLREALKSRSLWTARELGLWTDGSYEFISSPSVQKLLPYGESSLDLDVVRVTMEMVRYADEWQELLKYLPQGVRTTLQMTPNIPYSMRFDIRILEICTHVNLYRRVRNIADAIRRPELDVARDLANLVQQKLLYPIPIEMPSVINGSKVRLPDPAERLRLENFELMNLLSRMELEWDKKSTPIDQLAALVEFINWTTDALADTCRANGIELDSNTLYSLMYNEGLTNMGTYAFQVQNNQINVEHFTSLCNEVMSSALGRAASFYDEAEMLLQRILCAIFDMINSRIANPRERLENQAVWEAMFDQFSISHKEA